MSPGWTAFSVPAITPGEPTSSPPRADRSPYLLNLLARNLAEAEFLRDSGRPGSRLVGLNDGFQVADTLTRLQGSASPTISWLRDLIAGGYLGETLASSIILSFPGGGPTFTAASAHTADAANGATMLTIPLARALGMQALLLGDLTETTATIATRRTEVVNTDTGATFPMTAPDQVAVTGRLPEGAIASMHFRGGAHCTTPFQWRSTAPTAPCGSPPASTCR